MKINNDAAQKPRILIVEDNELNMELVAALLEAAGYAVLQADSGETAIELALRESPALILMDLALPGMDGLQAVAALRNVPNASHIPIVALTANAMRGDEERALAAGCAGYITKPLNTRRLAGQIASFLLPTTQRKAA